MANEDVTSARQHVEMAEDAQPDDIQRIGHALISIGYGLIALVEVLEVAHEARAERRRFWR